MLHLVDIDQRCSNFSNKTVLNEYIIILVYVVFVWYILQTNLFGEFYVHGSVHRWSHHKHPGLGHLTRSVSGVTAALSIASSVSQLFSFLVGCRGMISRGFGFVAFFVCVRSNINNCPTRCNTKQSIYYSASSLYMFRVPTTPIIRGTQTVTTASNVAKLGHVEGR